MGPNKPSVVRVWWHDEAALLQVQHEEAFEIFWQLPPSRGDSFEYLVFAQGQIQKDRHSAIAVAAVEPTEFQVESARLSALYLNFSIITIKSWLLHRILAIWSGEICFVFPGRLPTALFVYSMASCSALTSFSADGRWTSCNGNLKCSYAV